jgi:hypothetical protein
MISKMYLAIRVAAWAALAVSAAPAQSLNGLCVYMEYQVIARSFAPRHWYFLADGRYLNDAPKEELTPKGLEPVCAKYPGECGKYTVAGGKLNLTPNKGKPWTTDFAPAGANWKIGGVDCQRITSSFASGGKLSGTYTSGQAYGGIATATTFVFNPDGSYTVEKVGAVRSGGAGATSSSAARGAYRLSGNTLELSANGASSRHLIYEVPAGKGTQLVVDGIPWKKN